MTPLPPFLALIVPVETPAEPPPGERPPLHIWGGGNEPFPTPPIVLPPGTILPPLGTWGGAGEPFPTPPIVIPPPDLGGNDPIHIWGGANEPFPTPPIYLPPTDTLPPVIIIPPAPEEPIPTPPPPPDVVESAKAILVWNDGWEWKVVGPPGSVKPPGDFGIATPKGGKRR